MNLCNVNSKVRWTMWKLVVQNLLYFMHDLLPAAYSHGNWTQDGVDRAISWGAYCERTVRQSSQNGTMKEAFLHMIEKYDWVLSFRQLQNAQLYLFRFLIQNQLIDEDVKFYINQKANKVLGSVAAEDLCKEVRQQADYHKYLMNHLSRTEGKVYLRFQTRLLLEAANSFSSEELYPQLKQLIMSPCGLELLIEALTSQNDRFASKSSAPIMKWLENTLRAHNGSVYERILTQLRSVPSKVLCKLLIVNPALHSVLLSSLKREGKKLNPCYEKEHCTWVSLEKSRCLLKYEDLVDIYNALQADEGIALSTKEKVLSWCLEDGGMVWTDVISISSRRKRLKVDNNQ